MSLVVVVVFYPLRCSLKSGHLHVFKQHLGLLPYYYYVSTDIHTNIILIKYGHVEVDNVLVTLDRYT